MPLGGIRICPRCHSIEVSRSRRRRFLESYVLPLLLLRPYHCWNCNSRFYGSALRRKSPQAQAREHRERRGGSG